MSHSVNDKVKKKYKKELNVYISINLNYIINRSNLNLMLLLRNKDV